MNPISSTISISQSDFPVDALARLADDLIAALLPHHSIGLDLSGCADGDIRIVQLVDAARRHASEIGADLTLTAAPGFDAARLLARAGLNDSVENPFWLQGGLRQ